jgi:solute carrier family 12 sodium/potassium/chloride transporter 2
VFVVPDILKPPREGTVREFDAIVEKFKEKENENAENENALVIDDVEMLEMKDKCKRYMRMHELLLENSRSASLVVVTLPMPRKNRVSTALYMAWLEIMSKDMPPFLLVRGNQTNVLTFYS